MSWMEKLLSVRPFACPGCGKALALEDVNVGRDVALCRGCGYTGSFLSSGGAVPRLTDEEMARPPKRVRVERGFDDALVVTCRPKRTSLLFLAPFTAIWSGVSMAGIYIVPLARGEFDWKQGLFGLPFLIGTVGLGVAMLGVLLGKTTVTVTRGKVAVGRHLLGWSRIRELERGEGVEVRIEQSGYRVNDVRQPEIVLRSGGRELRFGAMGLSGEALTYVAAVLRRVAGGG